MENFKEQYDRYVAGKSSPEEAAYVEQVIAHIGSLTGADGKHKTISPDTTTVELIRKRKRKQRRLYGFLGAVVALIVISGPVLGGVFGAAATYAKRNSNVSRAQAKVLAMQYAIAKGYADNTYAPDTVNTDFVFQGPALKNTYYIYKVEVQKGSIEVEVVIDGITGELLKIRIK